MNIETIITYSIVAGIAIVGPGPAIVLAIRNGASYGLGAAVWSALGNICGIFCLSAAAMLGLGVLLMSSALLFTLVKLLGALYLFYIGLRHLLARNATLGSPSDPAVEPASPRPFRLYREAFLLSTTNPKPILFFTALFPQFVSTQAPLVPQFFVLTGIFMCLSLVTLIGYALLASRARSVLFRPCVTRWFNRVVGGVFISFGAALLALKRSPA